MVRSILLISSLLVLGNSIPIDSPISQHLLDNAQKIERHNANPGKPFFMKVSEMSSLSPEQYTARLGLHNPVVKASAHNFSLFEKPSAGWTAPPILDWRSRGIVNAVKDAGSCGADWAFSAVGALEAQHAIQKQSKIDLSEQNLIDCSINGKNFGCHGGSVTDAFQYILKNGINTESGYPYVGQEQTCQFTKNNIGETINSYTLVPNGEAQLKDAIAFKGPISVMVDANHASFQNYGGGIYYEPECSKDKVNLAMLVVGYEVDVRGGPYWILKSSFGTSWGEDGYMRLRRDGSNQCGITTMASFPTI